MKNYLRVLLCFVLVLLLAGCGSAQIDHCPRCANKVDFVTEAFCSNCGMALSQVTADNHEETMPSEEQPENELVGVWFNHEEREIIIFEPAEVFRSFRFDEKGTTTASTTQWYSLENGIVTGLYEGGSEYTLDGNELMIFGSRYEGIRAKSYVSPTNVQSAICGTWAPAFLETPLYLGGHAYTPNMITFYQDGTVKMDAEWEDHGTYSVVHDGEALYIDFDVYGGLVDFVIPMEGILLMIDERGDASILRSVDYPH